MAGNNFFFCTLLNYEARHGSGLKALPNETMFSSLKDGNEIRGGDSARAQNTSGIKEKRGGRACESTDL